MKIKNSISSKLAANIKEKDADKQSLSVQFILWCNVERDEVTDFLFNSLCF